MLDPRYHLPQFRNKGNEIQVTVPVPAHEVSIYHDLWGLHYVVLSPKMADITRHLQLYIFNASYHSLFSFFCFFILTPWLYIIFPKMEVLFFAFMIIHVFPWEWGLCLLQYRCDYERSEPTIHYKHWPAHTKWNFVTLTTTNTKYRW